MTSACQDVYRDKYCSLALRRTGEKELLFFTEPMAMAHRAVEILVPFYGNPHLAASLFGSLGAVGDELRMARCCMLAVNDSPDDAALKTVLCREVVRLSVFVPCEVIENPRNLGFVRSVNTALRVCLERRHDALLLNSDTLVFPQAISEMARVAALDPMIGFVSPRSNNATICSLPHHHEGRELEPHDAYAAFCRLSRHLPDFQFVPTAVGFCLLIKYEVLKEFGLLDESYGAGYNEENDLIMRANRCGYRAALANHAFVYHLGETSFSRKARLELEEKNAGVLSSRYPEYRAGIAQHEDSALYRAEEMLAALLPDTGGRLDIVFDFSSVGPYHNGTFAAGKEILRRAAVQWPEFFHVHVMVSEAAMQFHGLQDIPGISFAGTDTERVFALAFRFGQPFEFQQVARMSRVGVVNVYSMLDPIALDCLYLNDVDLDLLWGSVFAHADAVIYTTDFVAGQFRRRFQRHARLRELVAYHSLDLRDYERPAAPTAARGGYILVVGNHFAHKHVLPTVDALRTAFPERAIVALGLPPGARKGVESYSSGQLGDDKIRELLHGAGCIVFPSHYEGFGLPVLEGLACRKPVLARDIPVTRDIREKLRAHENLILYSSTDDLLERLRAGCPEWKEDSLLADYSAGGWDAAVHEMGVFFRELIDGVSAAEVLVPRLKYMDLLTYYAVPSPEGQPRQPRSAVGLAAALRDREAQLAELRNSWSWRITAPMRAAFDLLLKLRGR